MNDSRDIKRLLKIYDHTPYICRRIENLSMPPKMKSCIERLDNISANLNSYGESNSVVPVTFMTELKYIYENGSLFEIKFTTQQLRYLSYHLPLNDYGFLDYVLSILCNHFQPSLIRGLFHSLLYNWNTWHQDEIKMILNAMSKMRVFDMSSYKGLDDYLTYSGPYRLGLKVRRAKEQILNACSLFRIQISCISYQYFSDVIYAYYEDISTDKFPEMITILEKHNNHHTSLLVLSNQVVKNYKKTGNISDELFDICMNLIGNPEVNSNWMSSRTLTAEQINMITSARNIIQLKVNEQFVKLFFEKLCDDESRKDFWIKHSELITNINVYGSADSFARLESDMDKELLNDHFKILSTIYDTCALVMYTGNYAMIEFTDVGALYVYQKYSDNYNMTLGASIQKMSDLKIPYLNALINNEYRIYYDEGRMVHTGYWQKRLEMWIDIKLK